MSQLWTLIVVDWLYLFVGMRAVSRCARSLCIDRVNHLNPVVSVSGLRTRLLRPACRHFCINYHYYYYFFYFYFYFYFFWGGYETMSKCSQIAGSIGILPRCVLNDFFHIGVWTFASFVRPLFATIILCVREI